MKKNDDRSVPKKLNMFVKGDPSDPDSRLAYTRLDLIINDNDDLMMEGLATGQFEKKWLIGFCHSWVG